MGSGNDLHARFRKSDGVVASPRGVFDFLRGLACRISLRDLH